MRPFGRVRRIWYDLFERDIERVLSGVEPHNTDLAPLKSFVSALAQIGNVSPSPQYIDDYASLTAMIVRDYRVAASKAQPEGLWFGVRRRAAAVASSLVMLTGLTGVAWAANGAIPGDWNYGLDRALEVVGIGNGGAEERLQELIALNGPGEPDVVLEDVTNALASADNDEASNALARAAAKIDALDKGSENALAVRAQVSDLLDYLSGNRGAIEGQVVAELAKKIGGKPDNPGKPENTGKPADPGKP